MKALSLLTTLSGVSTQCANHKRQGFDRDHEFCFCQKEFHERAAPNDRRMMTGEAHNEPQLIPYLFEWT